MTRAAQLIWLDADEALDPLLVGAKAAALAAARRRGCTVLPGFVVPVADFTAQIDAAAALVDAEGVHAAQLALSLGALPPGLEAAVGRAAAELGERVVCRSSSPLEGDASWSGAFTSFLDVAPEELSTALRGCVASVFRPEVEARLAAGERFAGVAPSVLVQRHLEARCAGTAVVVQGGVVEVTAVAGSPAPLLAGWAEGQRVELGAGGRAEGAGLALVGEQALVALRSELARLDAPRGTTLEWAVGEGEEWVTLLQVGSSAARAVAKAPRRSPGRPPLAPDVREAAGRAARTVAAYAGPLGEALLLPWALAPRAPGPARPAAVDFGALLALGDELNRQALAGAPFSASDLLDQLAGRAADRDLRALSALRPVDDGAAATLLTGCAALAGHLVASGALAAPEELWRLEPAEVGAGLVGASERPAKSPSALIRWQRLLQVAVPSAGRSFAAEAAAPGRLAAFMRRPVAGLGAASLEAGAVLVVDYPLPRYAPLLWRAGALVARAGDASAHLFEVARARRLPALIVRALPAEQLEGRLALVDGDEGLFALLQT